MNDGYYIRHWTRTKFDGKNNNKHNKERARERERD